MGEFVSFATTANQLKGLRTENAGRVLNGPSGVFIFNGRLSYPSRRDAASCVSCSEVTLTYGIDAVASLENALSLLLASTAVET